MISTPPTCAALLTQTSLQRAVHGGTVPIDVAVVACAGGCDASVRRLQIPKGIDYLVDYLVCGGTARSVEAPPRLPALEVVLRELGGWSEALRAMDVPAQREVLRVLVERVVPVRLSRGKHNATVALTATGTALRHLTG